MAYARAQEVVAGADSEAGSQGQCRVRMIKYLGSKRRLVSELGAVLAAAEAVTALDLFTGTTRVAQEFCRRRAEGTCTRSSNGMARALAVASSTGSWRRMASLVWLG